MTPLNEKNWPINEIIEAVDPNYYNQKFEMRCSTQLGVIPEGIFIKPEPPRYGVSITFEELLENFVFIRPTKRYSCSVEGLRQMKKDDAENKRKEKAKQEVFKDYSNTVL
jgi:hypothetical protein